jgi:hypothetical protein
MPAVCTREEPQGTCQVLVHGSSGTSSSCSPKTTSLKHRGQSQPENTEQGPPVVVNIRPELPTAAQWGRNPAKAFYKLLLYPVCFVGLLDPPLPCWHHAALCLVVAALLCHTHELLACNSFTCHTQAPALPDYHAGLP